MNNVLQQYCAILTLNYKIKIDRKKNVNAVFKYEAIIKSMCMQVYLPTLLIEGVVSSRRKHDKGLRDGLVDKDSVVQV